MNIFLHMYIHIQFIQVITVCPLKETSGCPLPPEARGVRIVRRKKKRQIILGTISKTQI
jgi:hypothetical protein